MKPLLAHTYEPHRITYPCYVQPKLNGVRALYQDGCFQSRDELPWLPGILQHLASELGQIINARTILDGELYVHGWPLQRINGAVTPVRIGVSNDTPLVEYHIFDTVDFQQSFETRWFNLPITHHFSQVRFVESKLVSSPNEADAAYAEWVSQGYEGMMYRLGYCPYTLPKEERGVKPWEVLENLPGNSRFLSDKNNRTWHLLKRKNWLDDDYLITDFQLTIGDKGEPGFQLFCRTPTGRTFSVGSGLSDSERDYYASNSPIGRKAKVKYLCLSEDGIPLNPTILAIL